MAMMCSCVMYYATGGAVGDVSSDSGSGGGSSNIDKCW